MEFHEELRINPHFAPAYYYLGEIALARNKGAEAVRLFQKSVAENPGCVDAYIGLGKAYSRLAQYENA